jgi:hypothetical protein
VAVAVSYGGKGARGGGGSEMHSGQGWSKLHILSHSIFFRTYALPVGEGLLFAWCVGVERKDKVNFTPSKFSPSLDNLLN